MNKFVALSLLVSLFATSSAVFAASAQETSANSKQFYVCTEGVRVDDFATPADAPSNCPGAVYGLIEGDCVSPSKNNPVACASEDLLLTTYKPMLVPQEIGSDKLCCPKLIHEPVNP